MDTLRFEKYTRTKDGHGLNICPVEEVRVIIRRDGVDAEFSMSLWTARDFAQDLLNLATALNEGRTPPIHKFIIASLGGLPPVGASSHV